MSVIKVTNLALILLAGLFCNAQVHTGKTACNEKCCNMSKTSATRYLKTNQKTADSTTGKPIACKLTSPELQTRKEIVLSNLKKRILEKLELTDGYKYKFSGADEVFDELATFIKTERQCCDFFLFTLLVSENDIWLAITGPKGAKEFIQLEMDL